MKTKRKLYNRSLIHSFCNRSQSRSLEHVSGNQAFLIFCFDFSFFLLFSLIFSCVLRQDDDDCVHERDLSTVQSASPPFNRRLFRLIGVSSVQLTSPPCNRRLLWLSLVSSAPPLKGVSFTGLLRREGKWLIRWWLDDATPSPLSSDRWDPFDIHT